jgi:hypothetical protein
MSEIQTTSEDASEFELVWTWDGAHGVEYVVLVSSTSPDEPCRVQIRRGDDPLTDIPIPVLERLFVVLERMLRDGHGSIPSSLPGHNS